MVSLPVSSLSNDQCEVLRYRVLTSAVVTILIIVIIWQYFPLILEDFTTNYSLQAAVINDSSSSSLLYDVWWQ